jgi:hypothetical protein
MPDEIQRGKDELIQAFPSALRTEARAALSMVSENRYSLPLSYRFPVRVGNEVVWIPYRIYYDPPVQTILLTGLESKMLNCLFTRHHDGFVRQKHLTQIIQSRDVWTPCFVVQLVGEYVIEILRIIQENLPYLETSIYAGFVRANPEFLALTEQRVISYRDCYYRSSKKEEYPGFLILDFLKSIGKDGNS